MTNREILKTLRGDILQFIYESRVEKVKRSTIRTAYYQDYTYHDIDLAITYLKDRGYLDEVLVRSPIGAGRSEEFYSLTADGMLIVEGGLDDRGISIDREDA